MHARDRSLGAPAEPVPEHRIDDPLRSGEGIRVVGDRRWAGELGQHRLRVRARPAATARPRRRRDPAGAGVVPPRSRHRRCSSCRTRPRSARRAHARRRRGRASAQRAPSARATDLPHLGPAVGRAHQLRVRQPLQPGRRSPSIATAPAMPLECVSEISTSTPSPQRAAALPESRTRGAASPPPSTSTSCQLPLAQRECLGDASLAQNRTARWRPARRARPRTRARRP